jgi:DNA repair ATPase RecN
MAKKNKKNDNLNGNDIVKKTGKRIIYTILGLVIVLSWLAIFAVLIKLDVGGFGSTILRPLIKDIPLVNKILPDVTEEQIAYENDYPYSSLEEAIARIKELEKENKSLSKTVKEDAATIKELKAEVKRLKVFEDNQTAFEARVKEFDQNVVFGDSAPDISEYQKYYESINPTTAEEIYRQVVEQAQYSAAIKEKADIYRKMKPANAAAILETMTGDIDLVSKMLLTMSAGESSKILEAMDSDFAAKITKKMFDMDQENSTDSTN